MIKITDPSVFGWESAIRGMRNPMNSWDKSDSHWGCGKIKCAECDMITACDNEYYTRVYTIGENDLKLMKNLSKAGSDHSKYLRMINVSCDILAPRYWWTEYDTYKVGTVANSCSTMHKIHEKRFDMNDFSYDHLDDNSYVLLLAIINVLNYDRERYLESKDKDHWWQMIQLLPQSYNQRRTVMLNYQVLKDMYHARKNHKLDEWREFCKWCETLPYFMKICVEV